MFYAWRLVKWKLILNTNKFYMDSEKTSEQLHISEHIFLSQL